MEKVPVWERISLTVTEAAEMLGISKIMCYDLVHVEGFPSYMIGGKIVVSRKKLEEWAGAQAAQQTRVSLPVSAERKGRHTALGDMGAKAGRGPAPEPARTPAVLS